MINTSKEYNQKVLKDRVFYCKADIELADGTTLTVTNDELMEGGWKYKDSTSGSGSFEIGAAIMNEFCLRLNNEKDNYSQYDFYGASIYPKIGLQLSDSIEWIKRGVYTVDDPISPGATIYITALDNLHKFERDYAEVSTVYPADLARIVRDICTHCGVPLGTTTFDNASYIVQTRPEDEALTCLDVLSYVAQIAGCYARCNVDGALELRWYDTAVFEREDHLDGGRFDRQDPAKYMTGDDVDGGNFKDYSSGDTYDGGTFANMANYWHIYSLSSLTVSTDDVVITGIRVTAADGDDVDGETVLFGGEGYVLEVADNPLILPGQAQTVADHLGIKIVGMRFRPLSCNALGNPAVEAGDCAYVSDRKGNSYACYITNLTYTIGQYASLSCDAKTPSANSAKRYSEATKTVVAARKEIKKQISSYDQVVQQMGQLISQGTGMYLTAVEQDDGSVIYYMHDKPTIEESSYTCYRTSEGIIASLDGGVTWAVDKNGNALFNTIAARGITADWIRAGTVEAEIIAKKLIMQGGSINISTDSESYDVVNLNCKGWHSQLAPLELVLKNDGDATKLLLQAGALFGYKNDEQTLYIVSKTGVITTKGDITTRGELHSTGGVYTSGNISTSENINAVGTVSGKLYRCDGVNGVSGYFTTTDGKNVYVNGGIVTNIL